MMEPTKELAEPETLGRAEMVEKCSATSGSPDSVRGKFKRYYMTPSELDPLDEENFITVPPANKIASTQHDTTRHDTT